MANVPVLRSSTRSNNNTAAIITIDEPTIVQLAPHFASSAEESVHSSATKEKKNQYCSLNHWAMSLKVQGGATLFEKNDTGGWKCNLCKTKFGEKTKKSNLVIHARKTHSFQPPNYLTIAKTEKFTQQQIQTKLKQFELIVVITLFHNKFK